MPELTLSTAASQTTLHAEHAAYALAGAAVLAGKFNRPTLRVTSARLYPEAQVTFGDTAVAFALRANRAFLEETVMTVLAEAAAQEIKFGAVGDARPLERAAQLLREAAQSSDEAEVGEAYLTVLLARTRGELRRSWVEVEVVSMALQERGVLSGQEIQHRVDCVQGIRGTTLN
ncbi:hypothetical protein [Deinococcus hopiensis]|uniref:Uncharacterized protein n=1 Tax=Deinococcus hopiensis KR-140 TaxID=695939 RepID=A0A1W1UHP0_9DEIO|nr:hypothetical protein [Deinococcus hopiensis]SMB80274.1 hypothetical protein SAMN00790413_05470 [Deinococcus hopiensis KR-140]